MAFLLADEAIKGKKVKRNKPLLEMKVFGIKSEDNRKEDYMDMGGIHSYDDIHSVIDWSVS